MLLYKQKKNLPVKGNRLLISVTILGSPGPIRFIVRENDLVADAIDIALKSYARVGRLPVLGSDLGSFVLYCPIAGTEALSPWMTIGSVGVRNFVLCKKPQAEKAEANDVSDNTKGGVAQRKGAGNWKAWWKNCTLGLLNRPPS